MVILWYYCTTGVVADGVVLCYLSTILIEVVPRCCYSARVVVVVLLYYIYTLAHTTINHKTSNRYNKELQYWILFSSWWETITLLYQIKKLRPWSCSELERFNMNTSKIGVKTFSVDARSRKYLEVKSTLFWHPRCFNINSIKPIKPLVQEREGWFRHLFLVSIRGKNFWQVWLFLWKLVLDEIGFTS